MSLCQVDHVDIVAHTGTVRRGVVVSEHIQVVTLSDGCL